MRLLGEAEGRIAVSGEGFAAEGRAGPGGVDGFAGAGFGVKHPFVVEGEDGEFGGLTHLKSGGREADEAVGVRNPVLGPH